SKKTYSGYMDKCSIFRYDRSSLWANQFATSQEENAMSLAELLLPEFDQEMAGTRKVLERVPNDKLDWKAHPKSNTIGWVASHLADIPGWVGFTLGADSLDLEPPGKEPYRTKILTSREEMLAAFDKNV